MRTNEVVVLLGVDNTLPDNDAVEAMAEHEEGENSATYVMDVG